MKVLLTGADGYIGVRMGNYLMQRGHDVTGLDSGFHRVGWMYNSDELRPPDHHQGHARASPRPTSRASRASSTAPRSATTPSAS